MQPDPLPFAGAERPALVPDRVRDAQAAEVVHQPRPAEVTHLRLRQPEPSARLRRQVRDGARMPDRVRRLEIDEVRDREQRGIEALAGQHDRERGLGGDHRVPGPDGVEPAEDRLGSRQSTAATRRVELRAASSRASATAASVPPRRCATSTNSANCAIREASGICSRSAPGPAAPVPALIGAADALEHRLREPELLARRCAPAGRAARSSRPPHGGRTSRRPGRRAADAAAGCPCPAAAPRPPPRAGRGDRRPGRTWSAFTAMSSPNHFACSCASE